MRKVIVTGSTGCLGMALCRLLRAQNIEVIGLGRNQKLGHILQKSGVEFQAISLSEKQKLKDLCKYADVIFHCAAMSSSWGKYSEFYETNVTGTSNIIHATPNHTRLVHVSTPSVYFNFKSRHQIKESAELPKKSANAYIETKRIAEQMVLNAYVKQELQAVILRPRGIFGPYDRAIFPKIFRLYKNGYMPIIGSGTQLVDISFVDNIAYGLMQAAQAQEHVIGNIYNLTNDESQPFINLIQEVFEAFQLPVKFKYYPYSLIKPISHVLNMAYKLPFVHSEPPVTPYVAGVMALGQTLDISKAKQDFNYRPDVLLKEGFRRYAQWSTHYA